MYDLNTYNKHSANVRYILFMVQPRISLINVVWTFELEMLSQQNKQHKVQSFST